MKDMKKSIQKMRKRSKVNLTKEKPHHLTTNSRKQVFGVVSCYRHNVSKILYNSISSAICKKTTGKTKCWQG